MTNLVKPSGSLVTPRHATSRPTGPTWGPAICKVMEMLGTKPMPWQEYAADVIGELGPDGLPRWPLVVISVPRQSGKTTLCLAACIQRMMTGKGRRVWSTAQTGQKARNKWLEQVEIMERETFPLRPLFSSRKSQGNEELTIPRLGSKFSPHPPTEDSLHGEQSDLNFIDEGWVFDEAEAAALMQAIVPTQTTRPGAQTIVVSTMGTAASTWFHGLVDKAKLPGANIALIDYGISSDADPTDLDIIAESHPAFGHTVSKESLSRAFDQLAPAEFARAYGNLRTASRERFIPLESWESAKTDTPIPVDAPVSFGAAIDFERTETAIAAAAVVDGIPLVEIVDVRPGTNWAAERLIQLSEKHGGAVWVDPIGPSSTLADQMNLAGANLPAVKARDLTGACVDFMDRVKNTDENGVAAPNIGIRQDDSLDYAAEIVTQRRVGESWAWSRRGSSGSIAALEAATLAVHGALHKPAPAAAPLIR